MRTLAVIPARSGSKRIPQKNTRDFCGVPMLSYPLRAAQGAGIFDTIHVSTDSPEIAGVAADFGGRPSFLRPSSLSDDFTTLLEVIGWVDGEYQRRGKEFDAICLIYATAVFVNSSYLKESYNVFRENEGRWPLMSVSSFPVPVEWALRSTPNGLIEPQDPVAVLRRSQDFAPAFFECAMFIWFPIDRIRTPSGVSIFPCLSYEVKREHAVDIDTPEDWESAENYYRLSAVQDSKI